MRPELVRTRVAAEPRRDRTIEKAGRAIRRPCGRAVPGRAPRQATLAREAAGSRPIIAGPWTSEVGYEALYWLPFLAWAADHYGVRPERMIALSRGGTAGVVRWRREPLCRDFRSRRAGRVRQAGRRTAGAGRSEADGAVGVRSRAHPSRGVTHRRARCRGMASGADVSAVPRVLVRRSVARFSASSHRLSAPRTRRTGGDCRCRLNTWP